MTMDYAPTKQRQNRVRTSLHWLFVLIASALLHLVILNSISDVISLPSFNPPASTRVLTTTLITRVPPKPVVSAAARPKSRRKPHRRPTPPPHIETPSETPPALAAIVPATQAVPPPDAADNDSATAANIAAATDTPASEKKTDSVHYTINLPPSADLKYDLQKTPKEGAPMYGSGTIRWHTDGSTYTVNGDFGILFITALKFQSSGTIGDVGIVPELYSEKRFRKAETNTHFNRERNTISFSSSSLSYPRTDGEQDRATIIWQLAGIGRGDSEKFVAGATIDLFVAGTRDAETWHMQVIGQEDIMIDGKTAHTWHVARAPRPGSYDQKLDIWLAPQQNWYPVRLRYTDTNGDYLDMSLTGLNVSATP